MKFYYQLMCALIKKFVFRKSTGEVIHNFATNMGVVYIKLAQILSTHEFQNYFNEEDRKLLSSICDNISPVEFSLIEKTLIDNYGENYKDLFLSIDETPIGSASISQVYKAVLKNGKEVVIKVKRKDIEKNIEKQIEELKKIMNGFGKFINFKNFFAGEHALNLYLKWISEETDFDNEINNIKMYGEFSEKVNGSVANTTKICVPKVYEELSSSDVIVMDYIPHITINQLPLTEENKNLIKKAINSYLKLSFNSLLENDSVIFHGDPHSGNICVDSVGNIYFLDMGLLFVLGKKEIEFCKKFFFAAYTGDYEKIFDIVNNCGKLDSKQHYKLKEDCKNYCETIKNKEVTNYFMDMVMVFTKYELDPPEFLFNMAKAFVCLNGVGKFTQNYVSCNSLLKEILLEYIIREQIKSTINVSVSGLRVFPKIILGIKKYNLNSFIFKDDGCSEFIEDISEFISVTDQNINILKKTLRDYSKK